MKLNALKRSEQNKRAMHRFLFESMGGWSGCGDNILAVRVKPLLLYTLPSPTEITRYV